MPERSAPAGDGTPAGPLDGLLVCDLTRVLSGPFCTQMLADLGARVVKVERPGSGDETRAWGPPWVGGTASYFMSANRNKESVAVDLRRPEGREVVRRLALRADILVENFRPGTAAAMGLGYDELARDNPGLVYASISGFGQDGPLRDRPGYDAIAQAMSGLMSVTGEPDRPPVRAGVAVADVGAGMWAAYGILAALLARGRAGRGQQVDVSLLDGQVAWMTYIAAAYLASGREPRRHGSAHPNLVPYQALATADGHVMVAVGSEAMWRRFCRAASLTELAEDPRFAANADRAQHRGELIALIEERFRAKTTGEWLAALEEAGVACGPIRPMSAVVTDPQVLHREMVVDLPSAEAGSVRVAGNPVKLSHTPGRMRSGPPALGEHTDAVLAELGYGADEIAALRRAGAIS